MGSYVIKGGRKLSGSIKIQSAKNSVLPLIAASLLCQGEVVIQNCPKIGDVITMLDILDYLGVNAYFQGENLIIDSKGFCNRHIPKNLTKQLRSSIYMLGAILALDNKVKLAYPGGCDIGRRPIDIHLSALKRLGVDVKQYDSGVWCRADGINGARIILPFPSVGATENIILASVFCKGKTIIHNSAREPEIVDLANFINATGGMVRGAGTSKIEVTGVKKLFGTVYKPISDRVELATYMISAVITGGEGEFSNADLQNIPNLAYKFLNNTCSVTVKNDIIYIKSREVRKAFSFETGPFPKFSTDIQAQTMALLSVSEGQSVVRENLFENRFAHVTELNKLGAKITVTDNVAIVDGVPRLFGNRVCAKDLRGGAALVLAGLNAEGVTQVDGIAHVERGYYDMVGKLNALGADVIEIR